MIESSKDLLFDSEVKSYNPDEHTIVSYISTSTPDYIGDTVDPHGLELKRLPNGQPKKPTVLFGHDDSLPAVGKCIWIKPEGNGLVAKTQFADTERGRELEYLYANKFMTDFSIRLAFNSKGIEENNTGGIHFKRWSMPEYSFVNMGMNWEAVSKTKSFEEIKQASNQIKTKEMKQTFNTYIKQIEMEEIIKSLEEKNKDMESDIDALKNQIADLTSRVDELENVLESIKTPDEKSTENEKVLTIEEFNQIKSSVFGNK